MIRNLVLALVMIAFTNIAMAQLKVIYPNVNQLGKDAFGFAALKLALEHSGQEFDLSVYQGVTNNARLRKLMKQGWISISDFGTSKEYETELMPIYFPIDLGLNGWRIFLVHQDQASQFDHINNISQLATLTAGQGLGWADTQILERAGLPVIKAALINLLMKMTEHGRFDYFPLGANEAHSLLQANKPLAPSVIVEEKLLLIYPFGRLFFVSKNNQALHDAVKLGLERSFENGSFWALFKSHPSNQGLFNKANLHKRTQIVIDNPYLTDEFKKIPKKYFFNLDMLN